MNFKNKIQRKVMNTLIFFAAVILFIFLFKFVLIIFVQN